jgi:two-component system chemotaxis response regulator CheY
VLTDQNMPKMDGLTLIKNLRGLPKYSGVPILMLTTESGDAMKAQGKAAGATGWLVKPFDPPKLLEVVKKVIG